jgi:hypothetical protein
MTHEERLELIRKPFPVIGGNIRVYGGKSRGGVEGINTDVVRKETLTHRRPPKPTMDDYERWMR